MGIKIILKIYAALAAFSLIFIVWQMTWGEYEINKAEAKFEVFLKQAEEEYKIRHSPDRNIWIEDWKDLGSVEANRKQFMKWLDAEPKTGLTPLAGEIRGDNLWLYSRLMRDNNSFGIMMVDDVMKCIRDCQFEHVYGSLSYNPHNKVWILYVRDSLENDSIEKAAMENMRYEIEKSVRRRYDKDYIEFN